MPAELVAGERLSVVKAALDAQVERAVAKAPSYVVDFLGPCPANGPEREGWHASARAVEEYRHQELGLCPDDGPLGDEGVARALGPRPAEYLTALRWDATLAQAAPELAPAMELEPPAIGLEL